MINISEYYVKVNQPKAAKATMKNLVTSITKPGMSIAPSTRELLVNLKKMLTEKIYEDESKKIEQRLAKLDAEQCVVH